MRTEILRHLIDEFGRTTLLQAFELDYQRVSQNAICGDLGIPEDAVESCIKAGAALFQMASEQREFEDALGDF